MGGALKLNRKRAGANENAFLGGGSGKGEKQDNGERGNERDVIGQAKTAAETEKRTEHQ